MIFKRSAVVMLNGDESGEPGHGLFNDVLPADGGYQIRVKKSSMGEAWAANAMLRVRIR